MSDNRNEEYVPKLETWTPSLHKPITLVKPLHWAKWRRVNVAWRADLFSPSSPDRLLDHAFAVMALGYQHQYAIQTRYLPRAMAYLEDSYVPERVWEGVQLLMQDYPDQLCDWMGSNATLLSWWHETLERRGAGAKPILGRKVLEWPMEHVSIFQPAEAPANLAEVAK